MRRALHMILGVSLSAAVFSGVLICRELFDPSGLPTFAAVGVNPQFVLSMGLFTFVAESFVAVAAILGLIAGHRSAARELDWQPAFNGWEPSRLGSERQLGALASTTRQSQSLVRSV